MRRVPGRLLRVWGSTGSTLIGTAVVRSSLKRRTGGRRGKAYSGSRSDPVVEEEERQQMRFGVQGDIWSDVQNLSKFERTRLGGLQAALVPRLKHRPSADKWNSPIAYKKHPIPVHTAAATRQGQPQRLCASPQSQQTWAPQTSH